MLTLGSQQHEHFVRDVQLTVCEGRVWLHQVGVDTNGGAGKVYRRLLDIVTKQKLDASWLSAGAIREFFEDRLNPRAQTLTTRGPATALGQLLDTAEVDSLTKQIAELLLTLPWSYEVWIPTPLVAGEGDARTITLDAQTRLIALASDEAVGKPLHGNDKESAEYYHCNYPANFETDKYYFVSAFDGYVRERDATPEMQDVINSYKGFLGLLLADGAVHFDILPTRVHPPSIAMIMYRIADTTQHELLPYQWLTPQDSWLLEQLSRHSDRYGRKTSDAIAGTAPAFVDVASRTAARWYLDSFSMPGGLVEIVQATVSLEILLGERDEAEQIGIAALLANRLAYLVGYTPSERRRILGDFKRLYDLRSEIVHAGKARLNDDERRALSEIQSYAGQALREQLIGLRRESEWRKARDAKDGSVNRSG